MQRFSDRIGATQPRSALQVDTIDEPLQNSLWNFLVTCLEGRIGDTRASFAEVLHRAIPVRFFKVPLDEVPVGQHQHFYFVAWLKERYLKLPWYEVYNLIELCVRELQPQYSSLIPALESELNRILATEMSAYRLVQGVLVPISNDAEVAALDEVAALSKRLGFQGVHEHIRTALTLLGRKPTPDFRNSIKESISAVESAAKAISGRDKSALKDALDTLETKVPIHAALKKGFLSLYGYSSDADGIRHALLEESSVGFEEAKFMLVSCSAFATFLITKAESAGVLKGV